MKKYILFLLVVLLMPFGSVLANKNGPSAPFDLNYTLDEEGNVSLTWAEPLNDSGFSIQGYNVSIERDGFSDGFQTTERVANFNLEAGYIYSVYVTAYNIMSEGQPSEIIFIEVSNRNVDVDPPSIISGPIVENINSTSVRILWETDEESSAEIIIGIHQRGLNTHFYKRSFFTEHEYMISGLLPCARYFYKILNQDHVGNIDEDATINTFITECRGGVLDDEIYERTEGQNQIFSLDDSVVKLTVDEGVVANNAIFQIKKLNIEDVDANIGCPADKKPIGGRVYDIQILEDFERKAEILAPATVSISYTENEIIGIDEDSISIFHYNESASTWNKLNACILDKENKMITCEVSSFSKFIVSGEKKCEEFKINLALGTYHDDVARLQKFLNDNGFIVSKKGAGSPGMESKFFGIKTMRALRKYQKSNEGISRAESIFGFLGKNTREIISQ